MAMTPDNTKPHITPSVWNYQTTTLEASKLGIWKAMVLSVEARLRLLTGSLTIERFWVPVTQTPLLLSKVMVVKNEKKLLKR